MKTAATIVALMLCATSATAQPSISIVQGPGVDPGYATSLSEDGGVVVGPNWGNRYWTRETGMVTLASSTTNLTAVSGDGSTLVGERTSDAIAIWRSNHLVRGIYTPAGKATGVNRDGRVVSTWADRRAWNPDTSVAVQLLPVGSYWSAAVSLDGRFIVGEEQSLPGQACRWDTQTGVIQGLGGYTAPGVPLRSVWARAASEDGSVVVGHVPMNDIPPLRWTQASGWQSLPTIGPLSGTHRSMGVSGDGSRVVGFSGGKAFLWFAPGSPTPQGVATGMHDLNVLLPQLGVSLANITLQGATGISADGSTIAGGCTLSGQSRVYIATIQPPRCPADLDSAEGDGRPDGAVDINDLLFFLAAFEAGTSRADIDDNGLPPRVANGAVDINDLLYFLARFEAGC